MIDFRPIRPQTTGHRVSHPPRSDILQKFSIFALHSCALPSENCQLGNCRQSHPRRGNRGLTDSSCITASKFLSSARHVDLQGCSRLKSEIDAQGEIKVVKFPVSIGAAKPHISTNTTPGSSVFNPSKYCLRLTLSPPESPNHPLWKGDNCFPASCPPIGHLFFSED